VHASCDMGAAAWIDLALLTTPGQLGSHSPGTSAHPTSWLFHHAPSHAARADVLARHTRYGLVSILGTAVTLTEQGQSPIRGYIPYPAFDAAQTARNPSDALPESS